MTRVPFLWSCAGPLSFNGESRWTPRAHPWNAPSRYDWYCTTSLPMRRKPPFSLNAGRPMPTVGITSTTLIVGAEPSRSSARVAAPIRFASRSAFAPLGLTSEFASFTSHDQIEFRGSATLGLNVALDFPHSSEIAFLYEGAGVYSDSESHFGSAS